MSSKKGKQPVMKKAKLQKPGVAPKQPAHKHSMQLKEWAEMMTNPKDHECVRTPSEFATVADIKTFTRVFPLTAAASPDGNFAMVVTPTIENFFSLTSAVGITSPNPMSASNSGGAVSFYPTAGTNAIEMNGTFAIYDDVTAVLIGGTETNLFQSKEAVVVKTPPGGAVTLTINNGSNAATYSPFYWDPVLAAWIAVPAIFLVSHQSGSVPIVPVNGMSAIVLQCSRGAPGVAVVIQVPVGSAFNAQTQTYDLFDSDAIQLGQVERYRITALSLLASYSGNQFNDGGVIAGARCQPNFTFGVDPYTSLTKLIDHEKHGPMKDGAYVWWLPNSFAEREFIPYGQETLSSATNLRIAGNFSDPLGSLQITITCVVEFYSPLQIFNHNIGPVVNDEFYEALHALDTLPAATCNPLHTDILDALKAGAKHAFEFAVKNPALVLAAAKSISSML